MITLAQLLESRDRRAAHQKDLLEKFPGKSLICLTVQLPGPEKRNETSLKIADAGVAAVREAFTIDYEELMDLDTGYEGYFVVSLPPLDAKRIAVGIEDTHPLGRLMDIDVLHVMPGLTGHLSRGDIGLPERRCLLCDRPARYCMRAKTHTTEELLAEIERLVRINVGKSVLNC